MSKSVRIDDDVLERIISDVPGLDQLLELGTSVPELVPPDVQVGRLPADIFSPAQRGVRERREAEDRVRNLDTVDDPSITRDAEFVSG